MRVGRKLKQAPAHSRPILSREQILPKIAEIVSAQAKQFPQFEILISDLHQEYVVSRCATLRKIIVGRVFRLAVESGLSFLLWKKPP